MKQFIHFVLIHMLQILIVYYLSVVEMSNNNLRTLLDKYTLTGPNYIEWARNLKIVLRYEKISHVIEQPPPEPPVEGSSRAQENQYAKDMDPYTTGHCIMLGSMNAEHQKQCETLNTWEMYMHLKNMYEGQARSERYKVSSELYSCKMKESDTIEAHGVRMIGYLRRLDDLGAPINDVQAVDLILHSLPPSFSGFVVNYNLHEFQDTPASLLNKLKTAEREVKKDKSNGAMFMVSTKQKKSAKGKRKFVKKTPKASGGAKKNVAKEKGTCFFCGKTGHWKRNCADYLEHYKKQMVASTSGMFMIELMSASIDECVWVLDSGSPTHICNHLQGLKDRRRLAKGEVDIRVGNGAKVSALAVGTYDFRLANGHVIELAKCYYVPSITKNIISTSKLDIDGFSLSQSGGKYSISLNGTILVVARYSNGHYLISNEQLVLNINMTKKRKLEDLNSSFLWHYRLGHIGKDRISKLHRDGYLGSFDYESFETCESCLEGKMAKTPFTGKGMRSNELLGLVHSDVCGPMSISARGGYNYFVTFTDDYSRYGYVFLIKHKSEVLEKFQEYKNVTEKQTGKSIKQLRSDRGGEYLKFQEFLKANGIIHQKTPPYTPQLNGVSERRNRTLLDMVRSMMSRTTLPKSFWGFALETASLIINNVPSKSVSKIPYELWTGRRSNLNYLRAWGCAAWVKLHDPTKLEPRSQRCIFIGYPKDSFGYCFYCPSDQRIVISRHAVFLEKEFILEKDSGSPFELREVQEDDEIEEQEQEHVDVPETAQATQELRRSGRIRQAPERYGYLIEQDEIQIMDDDEPTTYKEVLSSNDKRKWLEAMKSEMDSMYQNQVWSLVDAPKGIKPVGCKWVFKKKTDMEGKVSTYKARLVAKGFTQRQGIDYEETFSPVAMVKSIRILLAIAAYHDYEIWQMDVKTAFLNGILQEEVYMTQPEGFTSEDTTKVCKLNRSIYGLKQASRSWNIRFDETIKTFGFSQNLDEPCVYMKEAKGARVFLVLYVDDILLIGSDKSVLKEVKDWLSKQFSMKDLGEATYILGIRIYRDRSRRLLGLSQSTYIDKVLRRFSMEQSKRGLLPIRHGIHLSKDMSPKTPSEVGRMQRIPYASAIGSIMYAMLCTRPDVSYALSSTSRFQSNPGEEHWIAVKNILKYLRRTKDQFLVYGDQRDLKVAGYTDASFQTDSDDLKSQTGYVFTVNGGAVVWRSSKQDTTADSTTEAEYIAASEAAKEAVWIRKFIGELGVVPSIAGPITLYCDSTGAIAQALEPRSHNRSKHVLRKYHLIREIIDRKDIVIEKIPSEDNIADPLTKALAQDRHDMHMSALGLKTMPDWS